MRLPSPQYFHLNHINGTVYLNSDINNLFRLLIKQSFITLFSCFTSTDNQQGQMNIRVHFWTRFASNYKKFMVIMLFIREKSADKSFYFLLNFP